MRIADWVRACAAAPDFDRHFRRAVWLGAGVIAMAAVIVYAGKAAEDRSAFIRWRPQVLQFWQGENIYDRQMFPNPPIVPILLYPLMTLPPLTGAVCWYALKVGLATASVLICFRMVRPAGRVLPSWFQAGVLLFSLRPILSDLHHGNNNIIILFLIVAALEAWRRGFDVLAGLVLALAVSFKVTPALFLPYFLYKRSWRTTSAAFIGVALFLLVVPSLVIGPAFNGACLGMWWHRMLSPFLMDGFTSAQEFNQSMAGVLTRLLTATKTGDGRYDVRIALNVVAWSPAFVHLLIKGLSIGFVVLLAYFCRTPTGRRTDPRLLGEFALVVLTMLIVSERSWKHHFVTLLLPFTYLMAQFLYGTRRILPRVTISAAMWGAVLLMATTSTEIGGAFGKDAHKVAQGYGMFLWAAVLLYAATAWRVVTQARISPEPSRAPRSEVSSVPAPHIEVSRVSRPFASL